MSHGRNTAPKPFAIVAEFTTPDQLLAAAGRATDAGYTDVECFSPVPVHGLTDKMKFQDNRLWYVVAGMGALGLIGGLILEIYTSKGTLFPWYVVGPTGIQGYAHNVGGKPLVSLPMFVPVAYECTILLAAFGATFGMFGMNGLPKPHQPIMNSAAMKRASQDRYVLAVMATDHELKPAHGDDEHPATEWDSKADKVEEFLRGFKPESVERVMTSEGY